MNPHPVLHRPPILRGLFCLCLLGSPILLGQQTPESEEVIELSPFIVDTEEDVGYRAANSLAGSRLNTALKDTPAGISVMTTEFLSDIGAFELEDAMPYALNVEFEFDDARSAINQNAAFQAYQTFRVRGLEASQARNYFAWKGRVIPAESAFVERIEESRGPNSVLFGVASPGGLINVNTKRANTRRSFRTASFSVGSFDAWRTAVDINQPLLEGRLAVRLNGVWNKANDFRHWEFREHQRGHLGVTYNLTDRTQIRVDFERGQLDSNKGRSVNLLNRYLRWDENGRPTFPTQITDANLGVSRLATAAAQRRVTYISNNDTAISMRGSMITTGATPQSPEWVALGQGDGPILDRSIADFSINIGGPAQTRFSRYGIFSGFIDQQIAENTFLELAYSYEEHSFDNRDPRGGVQLVGDPNEFLNDGSPNPFVGQVFMETNWFRTVRWDQSHTGRATLSHEFDLEKWGNYRVAAMGEYNDHMFRSTTFREFWVHPDGGLGPLNPAPHNAQNQVLRRSYPVEGDWRTYYIDGPVRSGGLLNNVTDPVTGLTLSSDWLRQGFPNWTYSTTKTGMLAVQSRYFEGRLIAALGYRRDEVDLHRFPRRLDPATGLPTIAPTPDLAANNQEELIENAVGETKTLGLVYHITPKVSVFYNRSDNISFTEGSLHNTRLPASGEPGNPLFIQPSAGKGEDFGVALDILDGRLYARATYYSTKAVAQSTTSPGVMRNANSRIMNALLDNGLISETEFDRRTNVGGHGLFDHESDGLELQITANATQDWRFQINLAEADATQSNTFTEWGNWAALTTEFLSQFDIDNIVTSSGDTIAEEIETYQDEFRFQTEGDGLGKLGNRRYKYSFFTRYDFSSGPLSGAYVGGGYRHQSKMFAGLDADKNKIHTNSFWRADLMAGYKIPKWRMNIQLNVNNVFDEREPLTTRFEDDGFTVRWEVVQPPRTWRLTTTIDF